MNPEVRKIKRYSVNLVDSMPDCVFIFGDNLIAAGCGGQAQIRYCKNSHGIPTKKLPSNSSESFFTDDEFELNKKAIDSALESIPSEYKTIVFPEDGLGTGLADLPNKAPRTYAYLNYAINRKFGHIYD
jgi:hypothetical protein